MACEDEKKKVQDLLKKLRDAQELQATTGISKYALYLAWAVKYGATSEDPRVVSSELDEAQAKLALCLGVDFLGDFPFIGKLASAAAYYLG